MTFYPSNYARAEAAYLREPDEPTDRCDVCGGETCTCDDDYDRYADWRDDR